MTLEQTPQTDPSAETRRDKRVVYLLGAGATQGCVAHGGSSKSLVMAGLRSPISTRVHEDYQRSDKHPGVARLVNDVLADDTDVEHLLTFLDESPSEPYRAFAATLRAAFSDVLRELLNEVSRELEPDHSALYAALVDMHQIQGAREQLMGFLTLNYDVFLEHAIVERHGLPVDYGISVETRPPNAGEPIPVLKLHGSFGWAWDWPIRATLDHDGAFWIPPGIRKPKNEYPFNVIWGRARELLDCDVLRIIGCNLGPNDWDLISLLFTTRHMHASSPPYAIEVISNLATAASVANLFPYLETRSLVTIPEISNEVIREALAISPESYSELSEKARQDANASVDARMKNPFAYWLLQKGEAFLRDGRSIATTTGIFRDFMDSEV